MLMIVFVAGSLENRNQELRNTSLEIHGMIVGSPKCKYTQVGPYWVWEQFRVVNGESDGE